MLTFKGWKIYIDGANVVATKKGSRLTRPLPDAPTPMQAFYAATEKIKDDIRKSNG